jgi:molybdopterin-guanine dinucleotide biosynthesis adapter protein
MKIVSFVAATSNSGKTTIIEKVVRILKERGLRVAVIKHASKGFELDRPGKDSWRFREAGADAVVLVGPDRLALMKTIEEGPSMKDLEVLAGNADIVIREGFKNDALNKIEVFRSGVSGRQPLCATDQSFLALVSDKSFDVAVPRFDWNDAAAVADFIVTKL